MNCSNWPTSIAGLNITDWQTIAILAVIVALGLVYRVWVLERQLRQR